MDRRNIERLFSMLLLTIMIFPSSFGQTVSDLSGTTITPLGSNFPDGSSIDFIRGYHCFAEGKLNQVEYAQVFIENKRVLGFQVALTGFNMWYPGDIDHHIHSMRVEVSPWSDRPNWYGQPGGSIRVYTLGSPQGSYIYLKFEHALTDTDNSNTHDACVGVSIIAHTRPLFE